MATVIAYGTNKQAYFDLFMASCKRHGVSPTMLGWGEKWIGFGHKTTETRDHIRNLPDDEVVLSVDPFDVVFLCGTDEIEEKFRRMRVPFLCGALRLGPLLRLVYQREFNRGRVQLPHNPTGYDFLNSGTWISTAGYARRLIDRLEQDFRMAPTDMDQEILTGIYASDRASAGHASAEQTSVEQTSVEQTSVEHTSVEHTSVEIDWRCEIFHNLLFKNFITRMPDLKDLEFVDGRVKNTATGSRPCILHASGNAKMETIAKRLGYPAEISHPTENNKNYFKKALFHVLMLLRIGPAPRALEAAAEVEPRVAR